MMTQDAEAVWVAEQTIVRFARLDQQSAVDAPGAGLEIALLIQTGILIALMALRAETAPLVAGTLFASVVLRARTWIRWVL